MERRDFLALTLAAIAAAGAGDVEGLLWSPTKKRIFIPPATTLISVNIQATREVGCWHDGLRGLGVGEFLTALPEWQLRAKYPDVARLYDLHARRILILGGSNGNPDGFAIANRSWESTL